MKCQRCKSERVLRINVKHSDRGQFVLGSVEHLGYAPSISSICDGDYTGPNICLDCGQTQGKFPISTPDKLKDHPTCQCSEENQAPCDDGDGKYCMYCGDNIKRSR